MAAGKPSNSSNSILSLYLGNVPQVDDFETGAFTNLTAIEDYVLAQLATKTTSVDYAILPTDGTTFTLTATTLTVTLPTAVGVEGHKHGIKHIAGVGTTLIAVQAGELIDSSAASFAITLDESVVVRSDGINWYII